MMMMKMMNRSIGMVTLMMMMNRITLVYRDGDTGDGDD